METNWQQLLQLIGPHLIWAIIHGNCELLAQMTTHMDCMEANVLASQTASQSYIVQLEKPVATMMSEL
jgi:hypothetical protein